MREQKLNSRKSLSLEYGTPKICVVTLLLLCLMLLFGNHRRDVRIDQRDFCEADEFVMLAVMVSLNHLDTEARDAPWIPFPRYTNGKSFLQLFPSDCANDEGHDDN